MVPTLSLGIREFTLAESVSLAVPTPQCPMAFRLRGSPEDGDGLPRGSSPRNGANHDLQQHMGAALPRGRRPALGRGEYR